MSTPTPTSVSLEASSRFTASPVRLRAWDRGFYVVITLVLIAIVATGFWPSYYGQLVTGPAAPRPWVMHLHGAIFTGWMLLLLLQVGLVAAGRVAAHRRVGTLGIGYGVAVLLIGLVVTFAAPVMHVRAGEWTLDRAAGFMLLPLVDMILFAGFLGGAFVYGRQPDAHKRLMLAATVALAFAAVARMQFLNPAVFFLVWIAPMLAGIAYDLISRRRVHPAYLISLAAMTIAFPRIFLLESAAWLKIGRALLAPFL